MAVDATGTPTSPDSILKYLTSADAPSGKGFNNAMDSIQTALTNNYVRKTLLTTTGDIIYASSANTPARLGIGSTGQALIVTGGVPVWGSSGLKTTVGTLAAGPPGSPATNDIWIATDVDANGTVWQFRYNSAEATYKWEFIGGSDLELEGSPNAVVNTTTQVGATGWWYAPASMSYTTVRAGDYIVSGKVNIDQNGAAAGQSGTIAIFLGATLPTPRIDFPVPAGNSTLGGAGNFAKLSAVAGTTVIGVAVSPSVPGTHKISSVAVTFRPVRII